MTPQPVVRKVAPVCRSCRADVDLIRGDGPPVCRACVKEAGKMGSATVRRNDALRPDDPREGQWR